MWASPMAQEEKNLPADPWVMKNPWRKKWQPIPVFLSGKSHGQRSFLGYSPQGRKKPDMTQHLMDGWKGLYILLSREKVSFLWEEQIRFLQERQIKFQESKWEIRKLVIFVMFNYVKLLKFAMFIYSGTTGLSDFLALKLSQEGIVGLLLFSLLEVDAPQKGNFMAVSPPISFCFQSDRRSFEKASFYICLFSNIFTLL